LYSAFYTQEEWRVQRFIDTVKLNRNLAKRLRTLVIMPLRGRGVEGVYFDSLVIQVLSLCRGIDAMVIDSTLSSSSFPLFHSFGSSRRLRLLSALGLRSEEFPTFMIDFNKYASLQVLELSVESVNSHMLPSLPERITFPSLHTLILEYLYPPVTNVIGKWELPSLKELSISRWDPLSSTALLPLIQRSYDRLEFFSTSVDLLHDVSFYDIIRAPPVHLRNLTFNFVTTANSAPPMHPAIKPFICHIVTLGMYQFCLMSSRVETAWARFFSDSTYTPRLRSVLTNVTVDGLVLLRDIDLSALRSIHCIDEELEGRGVVCKCLADGDSSFLPIRLLQRNALEVSISCSVMDRCSSPYQYQIQYQQINQNQNQNKSTERLVESP
jgi:hypothetical protein